MAAATHAVTTVPITIVATDVITPVAFTTSNITSTTEFCNHCKTIDSVHILCTDFFFFLYLAQIAMIFWYVIVALFISNRYVEEHIQKTGVAIETQGFTFVTSGRKRESLTVGCSHICDMI